jgi:hypothetical protein
MFRLLSTAIFNEYQYFKDVYSVIVECVNFKW